MTFVPYIVCSGDTLTSVGRRHGMSWRELYEHPENAPFRAMRPDPNRISIGDVLLVPGRNAAARRLGAFTPEAA